MTAPLSEERLEAIRAMLETDPVVTVNSSLGVAVLSDIEIGETQIDTMIRNLLAEVDRLTAENADLQRVLAETILHNADHSLAMLQMVDEAATQKRRRR